MMASRTIRHKQLSLLVAALLLLSNALVTAHAFGEVDHAVKDGCQILHQFERQENAPIDTLSPPPAMRRHEVPRDEFLSPTARTTNPHFQPRAPPFV